MAQQHTEGLIKEVVTRLDPDMAMLLLNVVYFHGKWTVPFNRDYTVKEDFYLSNGRKVSSHDDAHGKLQLSQRNGIPTCAVALRKGNVVIDLLLPDKSKSLADMLPVLIKLGNS